MNRFLQLDYQKFNNLMPMLNEMLTQQRVQWYGNQICLTTLPDFPDDIALGTGSLLYDWDKTEKVVDVHGNTRLIPPKRTMPIKESDFIKLCTRFEGTLFEEVYDYLKTKHAIGRLRIMRSLPKTCLTWHVDETPRLHYPIKTQDSCFMVIENESKHLPQDTWWLTDTRLYHTAFNASYEERIHLVGVILTLS